MNYMPNTRDVSLWHGNQLTAQGLLGKLSIYQGLVFRCENVVLDIRNVAGGN